MPRRRPISDITVTDVRSCPFCGSRELEAYPIKSTRQQVVATCIICRLCNARGPVVPIIKTTAGKQLREQSVRHATWQWNGNCQRRSCPVDAAHPYGFYVVGGRDDPAVIAAAASASADVVQDAAVSPAAPGTSDAVQDVEGVEDVAISAEDAGALDVQATGSAESDAVGIADADAAVTVEPMPEDAGSAAGGQVLECGQACIQDVCTVDKQAIADALAASADLQPAGPIDPPDVVEAERAAILAAANRLNAEAEAAGVSVYEYITGQPIPPDVIANY